MIRGREAIGESLCQKFCDAQVHELRVPRVGDSRNRSQKSTVNKRQGIRGDGISSKAGERRHSFGMRSYDVC